MTRQWVDDGKDKPKDKRWVMRCNYGDGGDPTILRCPSTSEPFDTSPPLELFVDRGWFIARLYGDYCPPCVSLGRHEGIDPHPLMTKAAPTVPSAKEAANAA